jgi:hypothetical protein
VASDSLQSNENGGRIIRFRPRNGGSRVSRRGETLIGNSEPDYSPVPDLSRYQAPESSNEYRQTLIGNSEPDYSPVPDLSRYQAPESSNEYRHRMIVNAIAFAFTSLLILAGICLTMMMSHP